MNHDSKLRDPKTGRFIKNRARKARDYSYGISLLKAGIYATCFATFMGILAVMMLFLRVHELKKENREQYAQLIVLLENNKEVVLECPELSKADPVMETLPELMGAPETEKPRPAIRVFRNGRESLE